MIDYCDHVSSVDDNDHCNVDTQCIDGIKQLWRTRKFSKVQKFLCKAKVPSRIISNFESPM